jgi:hypothetical protein
MGRFAIDVERWVEKAKGRVDIVARKIALDMFSRVILRSPVHTGRFRGNWQVKIGDIPDGVLELTDKDGSATISRAQAVILGLQAGDVIYLVNNLPYARPLENGWSKQAPAGMVGVTVEEFNAVVDRQAREGAG